MRELLITIWVVIVLLGLVLLVEGLFTGDVLCLRLSAPSLALGIPTLIQLIRDDQN